MVFLQESEWCGPKRAKWYICDQLWPVKGQKSPVLPHMVRHSKCSAVSSSWDKRPFGHNRHGPKIVGSAPLGRRAGSPSNTMWPGPILPPYQVALWSTQPFGHNRHGPLIIRTQAKPAPVNFESVEGCCVPLSGELDPYLTHIAGTKAYLHAKFHLDPSNRLATIHPTSQTKQTDTTTLR